VRRGSRRLACQIRGAPPPFAPIPAYTEIGNECSLVLNENKRGRLQLVLLPRNSRAVIQNAPHSLSLATADVKSIGSRCSGKWISSEAQQPEGAMVLDGVRRGRRFSGETRAALNIAVWGISFVSRSISQADSRGLKLMLQRSQWNQDMSGKTEESERQEGHQGSISESRVSYWPDRLESSDEFGEPRYH
jgi:hypothetical protein